MVKLNKIYTRTGDDGTSGLVDGSRVAKDCPRMAAIGDIDELNSALGLAVVALGESDFTDDLIRVQNDLFDLGADIATPGDDFEPSEMVLRIVPQQIEWLEQRIDALNDSLPPLKIFILPGGSPGAAAVHLARAITRRAERTLVAASHDGSINPSARIYVNRLSDFLFVLARRINNGNDPLWVPGASR